MNKEMQDKRAYDDFIALIEELRDDIKTVGTRSTWLLGILVVITLTLASFIFRSYGTLPLEIKTNATFLLLRDMAEALCIIYFGLVLFYIRLLIVPIFEEPIYEPRNIEELKEKIKWNAARLKKLVKQFRTLVFLFMSSVPASFLYAWAI